MKRNIALSVLVAIGAVAGQARADDITIDTTRFVSTADPAQVMAQFQAFRQQGVNPWADEYNPLHHFRSTRTRAEVMAEFMAERDVVAARNGEDSGSMYLARREQPAPSEVQMARH